MPWGHSALAVTVDLGSVLGLVFTANAAASSKVATPERAPSQGRGLNGP